MIVDFSSLFDPMADDPDAFAKGTELVERGEMQWLPTPVVVETYYDVVTARGETTEREVRNRLLGYPRVDVDEEIARIAGGLLAEADDRMGGHAGVGANDAYIAAMADVLDDAVLTDNVDAVETLSVPVETS